jgi:hypothetical protein
MISETLPSAPRAVTARARRRSWAEPAVRRWMILAVVVTISLAVLGGKNIVAGLAERRVILNGVVTTAKIVEGRTEADGTASYVIAFKDQADNPVETTGAIETKKPEELHNGSTIEIRYDPADPTHWTARTEPRNWFEQLLTVWILSPLLVLALLMMLLRRGQMLRLWRDGEETIGRVVDWRQSPIAPRSRALRIAVEGAADRRIVSILYPLASSPLEKDDEIVLVTRRGRAIVAELYKEN